MKLVYVTWNDAACTSGWENFEAFKPDSMKCYSVGWLVQENDKQIVVCRTWMVNSCKETG